MACARLFLGTATLASVAVLVAACGAPIDSTPLAKPTASPGPLSVTPATVSFAATGLVQKLTISDPNGNGAFIISGCTGFAAYGGLVNGSLSLTSVAAGICTLTISDSFLHQVTVPVSVNTLSVPVQ